MAQPEVLIMSMVCVYEAVCTCKDVKAENFAKPSYHCIADTFCRMYFCQCGKHGHIIYAITNISSGVAGVVPGVPQCPQLTSRHP